MVNAIVLDPDLRTKVDAFIQQRVKEGFASKDEIIEALGPNGTPKPVLRLQQDEIHRTPGECISTGKPADSPSDDENLGFLHDSM